MDIATISSFVAAACHQLSLPKKIALNNDAGVAIAHDLAWTATTHWMGGEQNLVLTAFPIISCASETSDLLKNSALVIDARAALQDLPATYWFVSADLSTASGGTISNKPAATALTWLGGQADTTIAIRQHRALTLVLSLSGLQGYMLATGTTYRPSDTKAAAIPTLTTLRAASEAPQIST